MYFTIDNGCLSLYHLAMNEIKWSKKALKQMIKLPKKDRQYIHDAVDDLTDSSSNWQNVIMLQNHQYDYRLRIGRYRVLFNHEETIKIVNIKEVKKRDERTY